MRRVYDTQRAPRTVWAVPALAIAVLLLQPPLLLLLQRRRRRLMLLLPPLLLDGCRPRRRANPSNRQSRKL